MCVMHKIARQKIAWANDGPAPRMNPTRVQLWPNDKPRYIRIEQDGEHYNTDTTLHFERCCSVLNRVIFHNKRQVKQVAVFPKNKVLINASK